MKSRTGVALAVGGGYLLGRTKKLKLAMTVAGLAAGRRLAGTDGLISRGFETLRSAPEFEGVRGQVQKSLVSAGRTAALTTASNAVGRITARVNNVSPRDESQTDDDADGDAEDRSGPDDLYDESEESSDDGGGDDQDDQDDQDRQPQRSGSGKSSARKRTSKGSSARKSTSKRSKASAGAGSGADRG